ncbi:unnamed protein product [Fraxinus pennsylvanica]|uniref:Uncharacterized protein n=1 Tax=Fraxinus pennsylvanica TaxID=56036 RepID=A0AAD1Z883_9LAMI|nr:unnamed protein product [Fraxinus pennsylvanica]
MRSRRLLWKRLYAHRILRHPVTPEIIQSGRGRIRVFEDFKPRKGKDDFGSKFTVRRLMEVKKVSPLNEEKRKKRPVVSPCCKETPCLCARKYLRVVVSPHGDTMASEEIPCLCNGRNFLSFFRSTIPCLVASRANFLYSEEHTSRGPKFRYRFLTGAPSKYQVGVEQKTD